MAFFDWNHDGKKNYVDNAIEMMIIDDIEADEEFDRALGTVLKIFLTVIASIIFIMNFFSIFFGYVSWAGLILSSVVLLLIIRNTVRKRRK